MTFYGRNMLGLIFEENAILAAEVRVAGRELQLVHAAEFAFPDDHQELQSAFSAFLSEHQFTARKAVVGVPARWLLTRKKLFPPADAGSFTEMVRLEAERSFATDVADLIIDYAECSSTDDGKHLLLAALPRRKAEWLGALMQSAGLKTQAITPCFMMLAATLPHLNAPAALLHLKDTCFEIGIVAGGNLQTMRHAILRAGEDSNWQAQVVNELQRIVSATHNDTGITKLFVVDETGQAEESIHALGRNASLPAEPFDISRSLGLAGAGDIDNRFAAAAALASAGVQGGLPPINFVSSHLAVRVVRKRLTIARAALLAAVIAVAALIADWYSTEAELQDLKQQIKVLEPDVKAADELAKQVTMVRNWTTQRKRFLDPLRELTLALPDQKIWITSLTVRDDTQMVISGKAADERSVLDTMDRIRNTGGFAGVKLVYMRQAGGTANEVAFSISGNFADRN